MMGWNIRIRDIFGQGKLKNSLDLMERAANFIAASPENYKFMSIYFPKNTKDVTCVLGWIGYFGNIRKSAEKEHRNKGGYDRFDYVAKRLGFKNSRDFYLTVLDVRNIDINNNVEVAESIRKYVKRERKKNV